MSDSETAKHGIGYINSTYGVEASIGGRLAMYPNQDKQEFGTIAGVKHGLLEVLFDGREDTVLVHPAWEIKYLKS